MLARFLPHVTRIKQHCMPMQGLLSGN